MYVWVDGIHFNIRLEDDRLCTLVMIGVRPDGTKELVARTATARALRAGRSCCCDLQRRRLAAPVVAVGDGALELLGEVQVVTELRPGKKFRRKYFTPDSTLPFVRARYG